MICEEGNCDLIVCDVPEIIQVNGGNKKLFAYGLWRRFKWVGVFGGQVVSFDNDGRTCLQVNEQI